MKKSVFILLAVIFCLFKTYGQEWIEFIASVTTEPQYNVIKSNDTIVEFEVTIPGMYSTVIDSFNRVNIKNHYRFDSVGFPEVPIVSFLVAIPQCDSVYLNVDLQDSTRISDINIYPAPELVPDTTVGGAIALIEQFAYNRTAYETNAYFPGIVSETIDKGAIREQNCVRVKIFPVQFNPVTKIISAYSKFKFTLTFENPSGAINKNVGIFNEVVGNTLINYQSNGLNASVSCGAGLENCGSIKWITSFPNDYVEDSCDYLIITHNNFYTDPVAKSEIESLAQHRADFNGFDVVVDKYFC